MAGFSLAPCAKLRILRSFLGLVHLAIQLDRVRLAPLPLPSFVPLQITARPAWLLKLRLGREALGDDVDQVNRHIIRLEVSLRQ